MRARVIILAALAAAGCGSGGSAQPIPADQFPTRFAAAWCALIQRCCLASGGLGTGACEAELIAEVTGIATEATADGATWSAETAGRCLDAIGAADCSGTNIAALVSLLNLCDDTWIGVVPAGGACMTYASCAEPPVSGGATAGASCVNGMCVPVVRQPVGATCDNMTFVCDALAGGCSAGACIALPGPGESCAGDCRAGARCSGGLCMAQLTLGAVCATDNECLSDTCSAGHCASIFAAEEAYCTLP